MVQSTVHVMETRSDSNPLQDVIANPADAATGYDGIDTILRAVRRHLSMDVAFVAEFRASDRLFRHVSSAGRTPVQVGDVVPLEQGFCRRVVDGRLPQLIIDAQQLPEAAALPETRAIPIGSHLSVPIRLRDGRVYGTFCCFSFRADASLTGRDLQMMKAFADVLADRIERERSAEIDRAKHVAHVVNAMEGNQPSIVYQPIYDLQLRRMVAVECLSRFQLPPQRSPDLWFAEAAAVGLGPTLEGCALRAALASLPALPKDLAVTFNVSPEFILSGALAPLLERTDPARMVLEMTEHTSVADYNQLLGVLAPLRALGLRIAVDDTGAGYSSLRHILNIEPNVLKLDISLVRGIDRDRKRRALASALIAFARESGMSIVAEGVECAAELETLQWLGVTQAQGYYLARPMPLAELQRAMVLQAEATSDFAKHEAGAATRTRHH